MTELINIKNQLYSGTYELIWQKVNSLIYQWQLEMLLQYFFFLFDSIPCYTLITLRFNTFEVSSSEKLFERELSFRISRNPVYRIRVLTGIHLSSSPWLWNCACVTNEFLVLFIHRNAANNTNLVVNEVLVTIHI